MKSPKGRDTTRQFERGNRLIGRLQFMAARREFLRAAAIETDDWGGPGGALHALYLEWCRSKEPALLEPLAQEARRVRSLIAPAERAQGSPRETAARGVFMLTFVVEADVTMSRAPQQATAARRARALLTAALRRPRFFDPPDIDILAQLQLARAERTLGNTRTAHLLVWRADRAVGTLPARERKLFFQVKEATATSGHRRFAARINALRTAPAHESATQALVRLSRFAKHTGSDLGLRFTRPPSAAQLDEAATKLGLRLPRSYVSFVTAFGYWRHPSYEMLGLPTHATRATRQTLKLWRGSDSDDWPLAPAARLVGFQRMGTHTNEHLFAFLRGDASGQVYAFSHDDSVAVWQPSFDRHIGALVDKLIDAELT